MATQSELDFTHLARGTDPASSHIAAKDHVRSGRNKTQKQRVLDALKRWPNTTSAELASCMNVDRYMVARRLPDLLRDELVTQHPERKCRVKGSPAVVWRPAESLSDRRSEVKTRGERVEGPHKEIGE